MTVAVEQVQFNAKLLESIKTHCIRERDKGGYEAVGFLARKEEGFDGDGVITTSVPLNNHCSDPQHGYFVEPWEQYRAETKLAEAGYEIVGTYHSHPVSEALPSRTDEVMARPGELIVIYSVVFGALRCWRERDGALEEVDVCDKPV